MSVLSLLAVTPMLCLSFRGPVTHLLAPSPFTGPVPPAPHPEYHFICECFFMTARALHLGVVKLVTESQHRGREIQQLQQAITEMEAESGGR